MSCRNSTDSHQNKNNVRDKSFRIRHDDVKLFSRFLSRQENSNTSFRVYYGDVSVPFVWESQPGTPKHRFADESAGDVARPPLTPPPSYYYGNARMSRAPAPPPAEKKNVAPRSILLRALLTRLSLRRAKSSVPSSPSPSLSLSPSFSSSSSSLSSFSATPTPSRTRRFSGSTSSFDKGIEDISTTAESSATCCSGCGIINKERSISMKKALLSIVVGRRHS